MSPIQWQARPCWWWVRQGPWTNVTLRPFDALSSGNLKSFASFLCSPCGLAQAVEAMSHCYPSGLKLQTFKQLRTHFGPSVSSVLFKYSAFAALYCSTDSTMEEKGLGLQNSNLVASWTNCPPFPNSGNSPHSLRQHNDRIHSDQ